MTIEYHEYDSMYDPISQDTFSRLLECDHDEYTYVIDSEIDELEKIIKCIYLFGCGRACMESGGEKIAAYVMSYAIPNDPFLKKGVIILKARFENKYRYYSFDGIVSGLQRENHEEQCRRFKDETRKMRSEKERKRLEKRRTSNR